MPRTVHPPEWPDKVMFAAMLQTMGGSLGVIFALLRLSGLRISRDLTIHLDVTPPAWSLAFSLVTVVLGIYGIRHQAAVWVWLGIVTGLLSFGMLGLVPFLSLIAIGFLLRSRAEGEETTHDEHIFHPSLWPDKALAASLCLLVGSTLSLLQAYVLLQGTLDLPGPLAGAETIFAIACIVAGAWSLFASIQVYRLRNAWSGYVAAALNVLTIAFLILGPALALATFVYLEKARQEDEFEEGAMPA